MIDWNAYRAAYDRMTYAEVVRFHDRVWSKYPDQEHYSREHLSAFFDPLGPVRVVEVGGWRGEAAAQILTSHPVIGWTNFEICRTAAESPVTDDLRYRAIHPTDWPWLSPVTADVAVLAHVIEHVRASQLRAMVDWLATGGVSHIYVEAPLWEIGRSWRGQTSAHVLELGWPAVIDLFSASGYQVTERSIHPDVGDVLFFSR